MQTDILEQFRIADPNGQTGRLQRLLGAIDLAAAELKMVSGSGTGLQLAGCAMQHMARIIAAKQLYDEAAPR